LKFGGKLACKGINIVDKGEIIMNRKEEFVEGEIFEIRRSFEFMRNRGEDLV